MNAETAALAISLAGLAALAGLYVRGLWRRRWTWAGLVVATGCAMLAAICSFGPVLLIERGSTGAELGLLSLQPGIIGGLGMIASYGLCTLAMVLALGNRSGPRMFVVAGVCLLGLIALGGTMIVAIVTNRGSIAIVGEGTFSMPPPIAIPLLLLCLVLPLAIGVPWALAREVAATGTAAQGILRRYSLTHGVMVVAFVLVSILIVAPQLGGADGGAPDDNRTLAIAVTLAVLLVSSIVAFMALRRTFLEPAIALLEAVQSGQPIAGDRKVGRVWQPLARSLESTKAELQEAKTLLQSFVDNAPLGLTIIDESCRYVMVNPILGKHYGAPIETLIGADPETVFAGRPELADYRDHARKVVASGQPSTFEVTTHSLALDRAITVLVTFFPLFDSSGAVNLIGTISTNITEQREAERQLALSAEALHQSEKLAALGQLLAGVSHELNNPLAAVIGQTALLAEDLEGTDHAERVGKIRRAADRCARIVQSFLAMARQKAPDHRTVALNDLVRQAVELTEYQMRAANVVLDLQLGEAIPAIEVDPDQLHQVIVNLLTNARQAMEDNVGERRLTISTSRERGQAKLRIADNGKGIPAEARARIFDPFFSTKDVGSGTGIGLSYSLGIVEAHGGTLALEDSAVGTTFAVRMPAAKLDAIADDADDAAAPQSKGRALVIDDEEDVADALTDMLGRMGLDVTLTLGGEAGRAAMADGDTFDLILSDIRMPDIDGPALYAWMAQERPDLLGRIAFVTGDTMGARAAEFLGTVDCPVLEKPFSPAALRDLVERMMTP